MLVFKFSGCSAVFKLVFESMLPFVIPLFTCAIFEYV